MNKVYTIFAELLKLCPRYQFERSTERYKGDRYVKTFTTWQQYITILYSQITQKDTLRDIETGLVTQSSRWHHLGLSGIHRSALSDANTKRDNRIFEDMFHHLLTRCRDPTPKHKFRFKNPLYTIYASIIDLRLSVFPGQSSGRPKVQSRCVVLRPLGTPPSFLAVTDGKRHEVTAVKENPFPLLPDSIVSIDKAYIDYAWLYSLNMKRIWFVTRTKSNMCRRKKFHGLFQYLFALCNSTLK